MGQLAEIYNAVKDLFSSSSLIQQSTAGGTQKLTVTTNAAVGSDQACRSCLIHCPTGNLGDIHLTIANEAADVNDFLITKGIPMPVPVDNLSDLHFYGANNGDLIYVLWRN